MNIITYDKAIAVLLHIRAEYMDLHLHSNFHSAEELAALDLAIAELKQIEESGTQEINEDRNCVSHSESYCANCENADYSEFCMYNTGTKCILGKLPENHGF